MLLNQRTNVLFSESDYRMLKALSKTNNQTIGELIRHAVTKTFKPKKKSKVELLRHLRDLGKTANTKGINYKQLVEDGRKY
jgi:hypothetical protein